MRIAGLFSGGKDSCFAVNWALEQKHEVKALISVISQNKESFMFHTPNIDLTLLQGKAAGLPVMYAYTLGEKEKELNDLKEALIKAKKEFSIQGITTGALASSYQKKRIESICSELNLSCFSPLWKKNQAEFVAELINKKFNVLIVSVAAKGLNEKWLGRKLNRKALMELIELEKKLGINVAGEGGEYETFVLDAPFFKKKIKIIKAVKHWNKNSGLLEIKEAELTKK
jgi:ABC transporter with metal-binding/Fe-S-binding domain ATP-binding protein